MSLPEELVGRAARAVADADGLVVTAGAGMGVDSGLPDFRGDEGFWRAYPPFRTLGLSFVDMANPAWFDRDPRLAWGFYGHRLHLYRDTVPHAGFELLAAWGAQRSAGLFAVTSNVDGQFQRAGYGDDRVVECHGSIHHLQCQRGCGRGIWSASSDDVAISAEFRAEGTLPECEGCGGLARPNILMFGDWGWRSERTEEQERRFSSWIRSLERPCVVEIGAGSAVPTIRRLSESLCRSGASLIRVNPREAEAPAGAIGIRAGALEALSAIDARLRAGM